MIIRIDNWKTVNRRDMEVAPANTCQVGTYQIRIMGRVYGHPHHPDGSIISTAPITGFDSGNFRAEDGLYYELGKILVDYESRYSRAREQLQARFKKQHKEICHVSSEPPSRRIADHR